MDDLPPAWYVTYTTPNGERRARQDLEDLGLTVFLPMEQKVLRPARHRRHRQRRTVEHPLFPRYMFVGLNPLFPDFQAVLRSKRVLEIMADAHGRYVRLPGKAVTAIMDRVARGEYDAAMIRAQKLAGLIGRTVVIPDDSPFRGFAGTVTRIGRKTARIEITALGATIPLEIPLADLDSSGIFSS